MARTFDFAAIQNALIQFATIVGADVFDCIELAPGVTDENVASGKAGPYGGPVWNVGGFRDFY